MRLVWKAIRYCFSSVCVMKAFLTENLTISCPITVQRPETNHIFNKNFPNEKYLT